MTAARHTVASAAGFPQSRDAPRIAIVAGEASGDLLGAGLMRELRRHLPQARFEGVSGPRMRAEGCATLYDVDDLSLIGFEGAARIPRVLAARRRLAAYFRARPPALYIGVDAPDFNLGLEKRLRAAGITTVHYVSPTVWAWREYRMRTIHRAVDHMLTLFPFEARYYRERGVPVTFVGHPMADEIAEDYDREAVRARLGLETGRTLVALLPGSRIGELKRHARLFVRTARCLHARRPELGFVAPFASEGTEALFRQALALEGAEGLPIALRLHQSRDALAAADVALLASGTATLEAALLRKPMVVTYRVSPLTEWLVRLFAHVRMYALPNHLAGRLLVPELMQRDATPEKLGAALEAYLDNPAQAESVQRALADMHAALKRNASARAAEAVLEVMRARHLLGPAT